MSKIKAIAIEKVENEIMKTLFKRCDCPMESWEVIIVDKDEQFEDMSTIYYHCDECGEDYTILDYYTGRILYFNPKFKGTKKYPRGGTSI